MEVGPRIRSTAPSPAMLIVAVTIVVALVAIDVRESATLRR
jgi:hypothetical protein